MADRYSHAQITTALTGLDGWAADGDTIVRTFKFPDHIEALGFVVRVGVVAETMNHHPDLRIVYATVDIRLSSHDAGGVTERDVELAKRINDRA